MNYGEAKASGYKVVDSAWTRGYVSRKSNVDKLPVHEAGGRRKDFSYVDVPSWESTRYCKRVYLLKDRKD